MRTWLFLPLLLMTAPAPGQQLPASAAQQITDADTAPVDPAALDAWLIALGTNQTRMTVPVTIGESGPYDFIIDTGAERTVLARELARRLGLGPGEPVRVTSMTGTSNVATVIVPALTVSRIARAQIEAPAMGGIALGAPGMLGLDSLQGHALTIDFDRNEMQVRPVKRRRLAIRHTPDEIVVVARSLFGQLIVTDARYRDTEIAVIVDTGSPVTIGNSALLALMRKPPPSLGPIGIISATGQTLVADYRRVDQVQIGGMQFRNLNVAFADAAPFRRFDLQEKPAMLLGMNTLRMFRSVQIDFVSRQVRFQMPRGSLVYDPGISLGM